MTLGMDPVDRVPLKGMRGIIARRMTQSLREMAQLTLHRQVTATELVRVRREWEGSPRPSINDLVLLGVVGALTQNPDLNATLEDDVISRWTAVHIGIAVAVEHGLVVPVIRNADALSFDALVRETGRLRDLAVGRGLALSDLEGGTFTVTNLGAFGIDSFTPIINPPQVAILGVGRLRDAGMTLSLTIDHRAVDGVVGARFLADVEESFATISEDV